MRLASISAGLAASSAIDAAICSRRASSSTIWPSASARRLLQPAWSCAIWPRRSTRIGDLAGQAIAGAFGLDQRRPQLGDARAQRARRDPVGLGIGDRRQARLAEGAAHLGVGDVAHHLGRRLLDAAEPRAQLIGAARHVGVPVARLGRGALGGGDRRPAPCARRRGSLRPHPPILRRAASATARSCARACSTRGLLGIAGRGQRSPLRPRRAPGRPRVRRPPRRSAGGSRPAGCAG